jgi:hypothetical protein
LVQKKSGPIVRKRDGQGHVQEEELAVEGNGSKWMPIVRHVCNGEMALCQGEEKEEWNDSDPTTVLQEAVFFL